MGEPEPLAGLVSSFELKLKLLIIVNHLKPWFLELLQNRQNKFALKKKIQVGAGGKLIGEGMYIQPRQYVGKRKQKIHSQTFALGGNAKLYRLGSSSLPDPDDEQLSSSSLNRACTEAAAASAASACFEVDGSLEGKKRKRRISKI